MKTPLLIYCLLLGPMVWVIFTKVPVKNPEEAIDIKECQFQGILNFQSFLSISCQSYRPVLYHLFSVDLLSQNYSLTLYICIFLSVYIIDTICGISVHFLSNIPVKYTILYFVLVLLHRDLCKSFCWSSEIRNRLFLLIEQSTCIFKMINFF